MPLLPALPRRGLLPTLLPAQLQKVNAALAALAGEGARSKSKTSSKRGSDMRGRMSRMSRMSKRRRIRFKGLLQDSCSRMVLAQDPLQVCHSQSGERKKCTTGR